MSFNAAIPVGSDPMIKSQIQTKSNFQSINAVFGQNHVPLTEDFSTSGMHSVLTFREQTIDPTTTADQIALYTKAVNSLPNLFFQPSSNQTPIQLTYPSLTTGPTLAQQQTFVAGPFVVYCGYLLNVSSGQVVTPTPTSTLIYVGLTTTPVRPPAVPIGVRAIGIISGSSFTITFSGGPVDAVWYFAIGKP
jgi:hypothetical protein